MIPNPPPIFTGDLRAWASKVVTYLQNREVADKQPTPKIIQLEKVKISDVSAASDGVLVWSMIHNQPAVSYNKRWYLLTITIVP